MKTDYRAWPLRAGIIWSLLSLISLIPLKAQEFYELTLEEAIKYALEHNKDLQNARFDIYIAERQTKEILSTGLPQLNFQADLINNFKLPTFIIPFPDPATGELVLNEAQFGLPWQTSAGLGFSQLAFDGTYFLGLKAADEFALLSKKNLSRTQEETAFNVSKAYFQAMITQEVRKLVDANISRISQLSKETKALNEEGFAEKIDVERLQINLTNLQLERSKAERAAKLSIDLLKFQMGMPVLAELYLTQDISDIEVGPVPLGSFSDFALNQRIEYSILETQRNLETYNMRRYKAGYLPTLYAIGNYTWNNQWDAEQSFDFYVGAIGLQLNFSIFDGMRKRHQVMQSKLALKKIENNFATFENSVHLELKSTHARLADAYNNLDVYKQNAKLAQKVFKVAQIKYKEGVGSSLELNNAESELKQSESNSLSALFEYLMAKVAYQKARGEFSKYHQN